MVAVSPLTTDLDMPVTFALADLAECVLCLLALQLRQQALALQKAAAAGEGVQEELRSQLLQARQHSKELQRQLDAHVSSSKVALTEAEQVQHDLQQQLADVARRHAQQQQQHR